MSQKIKILMLANRIPYPQNDGGNKAVAQILDFFLSDSAFEVSFIAMNTLKHYVNTDSLPDYYSKLKHFDTVIVNNKLNVFAAVWNLLNNTSYHISRFINKDYSEKIKSLVNKNSFDIIWMEGLYVTPYIDLIKIHTKAPIYYRQHNIEYKIWEIMAANEKQFLKKEYLRLLTLQLKQYEEEQLQKVNVILPISPIDEAGNFNYFKLNKVSYLLPYGIDIKHSENNLLNDEMLYKIYHIGAMDWFPNQEAVDWFIEKVMPLLHEKNPKISFHFAGRNMPKKYFNLNIQNVFCYGEVDSAEQFASDKGILVVPLQSASGIRIKTLDAMTSRKPVISTSIGANGLIFENGKHILIMDSPEDFADSILRLINNPTLAKGLASAAHTHVTEHYDRIKVLEGLKKFMLRYVSE